MSAPIPKTAPFADDEIESLNRVVGTATPMQRAWLAGFLAGLDAQQGGAAANDALPAAAPQKAEPLTILYATESGNSEKLAGDVAKSARKLGFKPSLVDMADLDVASLKDVKRLIVIAATWGEGEPPARAIRAYKELMSDAAPRLDGVEFGVLALGDTAYVEFCAIGKALDERLEALGGKARRGSRRLRSRFRRAGREVDRRHAEGAGAGSRARRQGDRGRFRRQGRAEPRCGRGRGHRDDQSQLLALREGDLSTSSSRSTALRRPTSRATRSTSMPRTIRPMSMRCCMRGARLRCGAARGLHQEPRRHDALAQDASRPMRASASAT